MLLKTLLTIHILGVIVWIGFGVYELLLSREIRQARGTAVEIALIRISTRYGGIIALATLVVAATGVLMVISLDWNFFQQLWLIILQAIMLAILLDMAWLTPTFRRAFKEVKALPDIPGPELVQCRETIAKIHTHVLLMRIGAVVAVVVAVFKPL